PAPGKGDDAALHLLWRLVHAGLGAGHGGAAGADADARARVRGATARAVSRLLLIAAGGTGGHMFPAQALAEEMLARGWRVRLSTDQRGARYSTGFPEEVERQVVRAGTFARAGLTKLAAPFQIAAGVVA